MGDTPADLEEGHNAGCRLVIGVTQVTHVREQLAVFPHAHLIGSVAELPALLDSVAPGRVVAMDSM